MDTIDEPLALPFRLGRRLSAARRVIGEGVGAVRHGEFSTGVAVERVTEWVPERKLAFVVVSDVPAMRELSPYEHVHAPHVIGYFRTTRRASSWRRSRGRHAPGRAHLARLKLDPVLYWLPLARWVVDLNNARVLRMSGLRQ